jgi:hypothetical protein
VRIESILLFCGVLLAFVANPASAVVADSSADGQQISICNFYRLRLSRGSWRRIPIYIDGVKALDMVNGRWARIEVPSGHHVIRPNDNQYGVELDLRPGETYYFEVRFGEQTRFHGFHQKITLTPSEQASYEEKQLKPLDSTRVSWTPSRPAKP